MMRRMLAVARRECLTRVRTKAFVIGTLFGPLLMGALAILPAMLAGRDSAAKRLVVVDAAPGAVGTALETALAAARKGDSGQPRYRVTRLSADPARLDQLRDSLVALTGGRGRPAELDGVLVADPLTVDSGKVTYYGTNAGSPADMAGLAQLVRPILIGERLQRAGVDPAVAFGAIKVNGLTTLRVSDGRVTNESGASAFVLAYGTAMLLYIGLLLYGIQVMSSVIEEKSSRILEVLVSSLSPFQLMLGKILGIGGVAMLQLGIWGGSATLLSQQRAAVAKAFGMPAEALAAMAIPTVRPDQLAVLLLFYLLGFLLFAALYAAVGAMCNSLQEAQQANTPVNLLVIGSFLSIFALLGEPNGTIARVLSFVPFSAPLVVPVRYALVPVPLVELLGAALLTAAGVLAVTWLASRIYRVGILMYGKRPGVAELLRWVRVS